MHYLKSQRRIKLFVSKHCIMLSCKHTTYRFRINVVSEDIAQAESSINRNNKNQRGGLMNKTLGLSAGRSGVYKHIDLMNKTFESLRCSLRTTAVDARIKYPLSLGRIPCRGK